MSSRVKDLCKPSWGGHSLAVCPMTFFTIDFFAQSSFSLKMTLRELPRWLRVVPSAVHRDRKFTSRGAPWRNLLLWCAPQELSRKVSVSQSFCAQKVPPLEQKYRFDALLFRREIFTQKIRRSSAISNQPFFLLFSTTETTF